MLDYELTRFIGHKAALSNQINKFEAEIQVKIKKLEEAANKLDEAQERILLGVALYKKQCERFPDPGSFLGRLESAQSPERAQSHLVSTGFVYTFEMPLPRTYFATSLDQHPQAIYKFF